MKRIKVASLLAGAALVAMAGAANATDFNIYGASAEFNFWKNAGREFLLNSTPHCTGTVSSFITATADSKSGIIYATGCDTTVVPDGIVKFRVSNKASFDGIFAVTQSTDSNGSANTCAASDRGMADMTAVTDSTASYSCQTVTVGASDVPANAFVQKSIGKLKGPLAAGTDATVTRWFTSGAGIPVTVAAGAPVAPAATYNPVKVPFGIFVTGNITVKTCTAGPTIGDYCNKDEDCGNGGLCNGGDATGTVTAFRAIALTDNITREMATQVFSNTLPNHNWSDFAGFGSLPAVACVRAAGSGSHATIDLGLMNKAWGKSFPLAAAANQFYYNDSTGNLLDCMNWASTNAKGAMGYADADVDTTNGGKYATVIGPLKYNGNYPNSQNIISGNYDLFADQTLYLAAGADATQTTLMSNLMTYLNDNTGSHLNTAGYNFKNFWAASSEMKVGRGNTAATLSPFAYPYRGGQNPTQGL